MKDREAAITIYHNGECSKCKGALELLQEKNIPHTVRWYLTDPLTRAELLGLLHKLDLPPSALIRKSEDLYKEHEQKQLTEAEWLALLLAHPALMQRPIVEQGTKAIIARPPEKLFSLIGEVEKP